MSTEWFFYIAYTIVLFRIALLRSLPSAIGATLVFVLFIVAISAWGADHRGIFIPPSDKDATGNIGDFNNSFYRWALYFSPYARLPEFILGCLTAQVYAKLGKAPTLMERRFGAVAAITAIAFLAWGGWAWLNMSADRPVMTDYVSFMSLNFGFAPAIAVIIFCAARYPGYLAVFLSLPALVALGERSYSIYLVQEWIVPLFAKVGPLPVSPWTLTDGVFRVVLGIVATIAVADCTYRLVEVPARRWLRDRLSASKAAPRSLTPVDAPSALIFFDRTR